MKHWTILIFVIFSGACQDVKSPEKPENLIDKDKMATILTEAYLVNAARSVDNKTIVESGISLDSLFYSRFGIDSLQLAQSNAFYATNVNDYMEIFQVVEARLDAMQKKLDSIRIQATQLNDSVSDKTNHSNPF